MDQVDWRLVGRRIRLTRWMSGTSQEELSAATGISLTALRAYEAGMAKPSADVLSTLADEQSVTIDFYVSSDDAIQPDATNVRLPANGAGSI